MGLKKACRQYSVPRATLQRRYKSNLDTTKAASKGLGSRDNVFDLEMEQELVSHVKTMEGMLFGFTPKRLRRLAYQLAKSNNIHHRFNMDKKEAGKEWYRGFMSRHPDLSLCTPEATSAARAQGFNPVSVGKFFDLLEKLQNQYNFTPDKVFNCDETGITTVPNRPSKVIASRGKKQVGALSSAERGQLVTVEICMSASGSFIPPYFVFPRCRLKSELLDAAPPGSQAAAHPSGWMQSDIFVKWFDHFLLHAHPTAETPALLILDGHKTHTSNLEVINKAREQHVSILCLPPHCSHRLQPLDVSFMKPLSTFYTQEVEKWLINHPGRVVTVQQLPSLFRDAYLRAAGALMAVNGFKKTGIWPINRDIFSEADFAAAVPTDIPLNSDVVDDVATSPGVQSAVVHNDVEPDSDEPVASTSCGPNNSGSVVEQTHTDQKDVACNSGSQCEQAENAEQRTVHVLDISPFPKAQHRADRKVVRTRGKTVVLTSSPYKQELMNKRQLIQDKEDAAEARKAKSLKLTKDSTLVKPGRETTTVTKGKGKGGRKGKGKAKAETVNKSRNEGQGTPCSGCGVREFSEEDKQMACGWVACQKCGAWFHDPCAECNGILDDENFMCRNCCD